MLNKWIYKHYTDDGCCVYACLSCNKEWEARTSPNWAKWKFCPYCGTQWEDGIDGDIVESAREEKHKVITWNQTDYVLQQRFIDTGYESAWEDVWVRNYMGTPEWDDFKSRFPSGHSLRAMASEIWKYNAYKDELKNKRQMFDGEYEMRIIKTNRRKSKIFYEHKLPNIKVKGYKGKAPF